MRAQTTAQLFRTGSYLAPVVVATLTALTACAPTAEDDDIAGVVTRTGEPEAGVWVIAETADLSTRFARIVVTDDQGRYVIPDLPEASYDVWVRGYGLVDSEKLKTSPGTVRDLTAVAAPDARAAAEYYPAGYWLSLLHVPEDHEFPGTGDEGNGISPNIRNQAQLLRLVKSGNCTACHQLGTMGTRMIPEALGEFESSVAAWDRRIRSGQAGAGMSAGLDRIGRPAMLEMFADWTDRIAAGETPTAASPAKWHGAQRGRHAVGLGGSGRVPPRRGLYGQAEPHGQRERAHLRGAGTQRRLRARSGSDEPHREPGPSDRPRPEHTARVESGHARASPYWGDEVIWTSKNKRAQPHARPEGSGLAHVPPCVPRTIRTFAARFGPSSAQLFPTTRARRHLALYDPETEELTHISTASARTTSWFAEDENNTLWDERRRTGRGLAEHQDVRRDR